MKKIQTVSKFFIKKLIPEAILPKKGTSGAAGYDLSSI
jgi:dUTPase